MQIQQLSYFVAVAQTKHFTQAAELLATVIGQDLQQDAEGTFRIVRRVAADRVISTVDADARHGRKSTSGKFDGYKGHAAIDPDSEIITAAAAGPANAGDGQMVGRLTADLDELDRDTDEHDDTGGDDDGEDGGPRAVYGDAAYGSGEQLADLEARGIDARVKTQPPAARNGKFSKDEFTVDLDAEAVTCPAGTTVPIVRAADGSGTARFGRRCQGCPLRGRCTDSTRGRDITIHRYEALLARQRVRIADPDWAADYRATRPKVERKLAHLGRRWHGGRRARVRGLQRVAQDWGLNAAAHNLARLATLGVRSSVGRWQVMPA
jgi:hypothetical protein